MNTEARKFGRPGQRRLPRRIKPGPSAQLADFEEAFYARPVDSDPWELPGGRTTKPKTARLRPYRQGELDGLCGIYAAINAVRLALGPGDAKLGIDDWQHLFTVMLAAADDRMGAYTATTVGIGTKQLVAILKVARQHLADEHHLELTVRRVTMRGERLPLAATLARLADLAAAPRSAVILSLCGHLDHWSVLKRVNATSLELFDSYGFARVALSNCRMSFEPARAPQREHVLHGRALMSVTVRA